MKIVWQMWAVTVLATCSILGAADAPRIMETVPADGALDVPVGTHITVTFDRRMDPATLDPARILVNGRSISEIEQAGTVMPDPEGRQVVILLRMHQDRVYGITLLPGLADMHGNTLDKPFAWKFATSSRSQEADIPVKAFARFPRMNDCEVPTNAPITAVFINALDPASVTTETFIVRQNVTNEPVAGNFTVKANRVAFRPAVSLEPNTTYEVELASGIKNTMGRAMERPSIWQFTTADGPVEGPIVADIWSEDHTDRTERSIILHAAVENLVLPGKGDRLPTMERAVLAKGHTLRAAILPLKEVAPVQELSPVTPEPSPIAPTVAQTEAEGPTTTVVAAYSHGGGKGIGNNTGNGLDPELGKIRSAATAALAKTAIPAFQDSGEVIAHGDRTEGDNIYSTRFVLDDTQPGGLSLIAFMIVLPDGSCTEPVTHSLYIQPPWQESEDPKP